MAPKTTRRSRAAGNAGLLSLEPIPSVGHEHRQKQAKKEHTQPTPTLNGNMKLAKELVKGNKDTRSGAKDSTSGDMTGDGVAGSSVSSTKADEDDEGDDNSNAIAPLDRAMREHGSQAGLSGFMSGRDMFNKRKRRVSSAGLEIEEHRAKQMRSSNANEGAHRMLSLGMDFHSPSDSYHSHGERHTNPYHNALTGGDSCNLEVPNVRHFDDQYGRLEPGVHIRSQILLHPASTAVDDTPGRRTTPVRRVHFQDPAASLSISSVNVKDEDLHDLLNDVEIPDNHLTYEKFWANVNAEEDLSGYESDYGDTTDEELSTVRPETIQPRLSPSPQYNGPLNAKAASNSFQKKSSPKNNLPGPRMGSFSVARSKPHAMLDATGDNMIVVAARCPTGIRPICPQRGSTATSIACPSPVTPHSQTGTARHIDEIDLSNIANHTIGDPTLAPASNIVPFPTTPSNPPISHVSQSAAGDSVFFPLEIMGGVSAIYAVNDNEQDDDDLGEDLVNAEDWLDFIDDSSNDGSDVAEEDAIARATLPTPLTASPNLPIISPTTVGAFRLNQEQQSVQASQGGYTFERQAFKGAKLPI